MMKRLLFLWLAYFDVSTAFLSGLMGSHTLTSSPTRNSYSLPGSKATRHGTPLAGSILGQQRARLALPGTSIVLEPMLGANREFWAPLDTMLPTASSFESVVRAATKKNDYQRTTFDTKAPVHILRADTNGVWNDWEFTPDAAIEAAESTGIWSTGRHHLYPTTDQVAVDLPLGMGDACLQMATRTILPAIAFAFDTPLSTLYFKDMFLAKYEPTGQPGLGKHTDGSAYSFNMLLSTPKDDFEGGGTWIEPVGLVSPLKGEVLLHRGSILHEGCPVTQGTRYVLVGFVQQRVNDGRDDDHENNSSDPRQSELFLKTVETFPLGMVIEVDEGDAQKCAIVADIVQGGAASLAAIQKQDCLRAIVISAEEELITLDDKTFDQVMDILVSRKDLGPMQLVLERWIS